VNLSWEIPCVNTCGPESSQIVNISETDDKVKISSVLLSVLRSFPKSSQFANIKKTATKVKILADPNINALYFSVLQRRRRRQACSFQVLNKTILL
jgi:hypothetical protein